MKITAENKAQEIIEIVTQKQIEKKKVQLGSSILKPGHTCFELNTKTLSCVPAKHEPQANFAGVLRSRIITKENCVYINALNKKNVLKIYKRDFEDMDRIFNNQQSFSKINIYDGF